MTIVTSEDLRTWFRQKWVRMDTKGNIKGDCAREDGEGKPKCLPAAKARSMSKQDRATAARRKRREDPVADRAGKGNKPVMVNTEEFMLEKNEPTNPSLWSKAKSLARQKFDVYPSAYANGWASKYYKSKGGGWKSVSEETVDEACWTGYKRVGMKKKGDRMVPNCVPENALLSFAEFVSLNEAAIDAKGHKSSTGGLTQKGRDAYNAKGGNLQAPVTTPPSKLKAGSKAAGRRKSFCARMSGVEGPMKDEKGRPTRKALALRKWNC